MEDLIVVGGSGFGKEVIWLAEQTGQFNIIGVIDDNSERGAHFYGKRILGKTEEAKNFKKTNFIIAIGNPRVRKLVYEKLINSGACLFPNLIHPSVIMSNTVEIGSGNIICAGTILTTDIALGNQNIINLNCTVGHDTVIGNFCTIAPMVAISGNVHLDDLTEVGTSASIRQGIKISKGGMLGMGGVLTKNIDENQIFVGNPAKFLKDFS